jgi:uncharacterized protein YndB with AHSA1/START domain
MTVVSVDKDVENLAVTLVAELDAPLERAWELWADPRKLERWWGPPNCPATFHEHDLTPGGTVAFTMALPDGGTSRGWWRVASVDAPRSLAFTDGWADEHGTPRPEMPTTEIRVELSETDGRTRMEIRSTFKSREHMEQLVRMGAVEAFADAVGQMDAVLAG